MTLYIHETYQNSFLDSFLLNLSFLLNFFHVCYIYGIFVLKKHGFCRDEISQMHYKYSLSEHF